jgi:aspartate-semialdehyde dehydrogenase
VAARRGAARGLLTTLAIVRPTTLLGKELREGLDKRRGLGDELRLLTTDDEEVGALTEARGAAALVQRADADSLDGVDLAFFCGPIEANRPLLDQLPSETTAIVLSPDATRGDGVPVVAGVNLDEAAVGQVLISPHPGAIALAHLLFPLRRLGLESASATLVQPVSMREETALHELFEQTRRILSFSEQRPGTFGKQLAFNLLPAQPAAHLTGQLEALLGDQLELTAQVVQGGVFHGFALSVYVRFAADPGLPAVREALRRQPHVELARKPELLGPIDAAGKGEVLVGRIEPEPRRPGGYWLWAAMDNLTRGGALNALEIAAAVLE